LNLYEKLHALMKAIPSITKTGQHQESGSGGPQYSYIEANELKKQFRRYLLRLKLLCLPVAIEHSSFDTPTASGSRLFHSVQKITFRFIDIESGIETVNHVRQPNFIDCQSIGHGCDPLATDAPKAAIQALKYFLSNAFFVEGLEVDGDSGEDAARIREAANGQRFTAELTRVIEDTGSSYLVVYFRGEGNARETMAMIPREKKEIYHKLAKKIGAMVTFRAIKHDTGTFEITKLSRNGSPSQAVLSETAY
jgi:hypothetical protein